MARSDAQRWTDWRVGPTAVIRSWRRCRCGEMFEATIRGQSHCLRCVQLAREAEAEAMMEALIVECDVDERIRATEQADAQRRADEGAVKFARPHRSKEENRTRYKKNYERPRPRGAKAGSHGGSNSPRVWHHVARRRAREGMSTRKIAKMLDVSVAEVQAVLKPTP